MEDKNILSTESLRSYNRGHIIGASTLAALLGLMPSVFGIGPRSPLTCGNAVATPAVTAPAVSPPAVSLPTSTPAAVPETTTPTPAAAVDIPPAARIYFATSRWTLPSTTDSTLSAVLAYLRANPSAKAVISGFHDPRGDKAANEELARNRANAVQAALVAAGMAADRIVMEKPQETTGTGSLAEARRVEVSVQRQ